MQTSQWRTMWEKAELLYRERAILIWTGFGDLSLSDPKVNHGLIALPSYYIFSNEKMTAGNTFKWKKQTQKVYILGMVSISNWPSWPPVYSMPSLFRPIAKVLKTAAWLGCTRICTCVCVLMGMLMQFAGLFHKVFIVLVWPAVSTGRGFGGGRIKVWVC